MLNLENSVHCLHRWKIYIINSFLIANEKRMSNDPMESLNGRIKRLLHDGYGYSNFDSFKKIILFVSNKNEPVIFQKKFN